MDNSLQQENDNSLRGRILNNSSLKVTYSLRVDKLLYWKPEHITLSLNKQIEKELTKVNFWGMHYKVDIFSYLRYEDCKLEISMIWKYSAITMATASVS